MLGLNTILLALTATTKCAAERRRRGSDRKLFGENAGRLFFGGRAMARFLGVLVAALLGLSFTAADALAE